MEELFKALKSAKCVAAMTGAGISTLCGIPDFRGPQGLYKNPDAERIFDIDWFERDPRIYYKGCRELIYGLSKYEPGPVHNALKALEDAGMLAGIITQNIDMLHQKAGSSHVYEVHGSPIVHRCRRCGKTKSFDETRAMIEANGGLSALGESYVPQCECGGVFKPDITFFGEALPEAAFTSAHELASKADVMIVLGTSLTVYPAAGLPQTTLRSGGKVFIVNGQATPIDRYAAHARYEDLAQWAAETIRWLEG